MEPCSAELSSCAAVPVLPAQLAQRKHPWRQSGICQSASVFICWSMTLLIIDCLACCTSLLHRGVHNHRTCVCTQHYLYASCLGSLATLHSCMHVSHVCSNTNAWMCLLPCCCSHISGCSHVLPYMEILQPVAARGHRVTILTN